MAMLPNVCACAEGMELGLHAHRALIKYGMTVLVVLYFGSG
jgi:hypothetical protein